MVKFAYILAGGQSRRFGTNKALVRVLGQPLLLKLKLELEQCNLEVTVVSQSRSDYLPLGIPCLSDSIQNSGPLAGLATALDDCRDRKEEWCMVLTCDMVMWRPEWLRELANPLQSPNSGDSGLSVTSAQMVGFRSNHFLPFPALYRVSLRPTIQSLWEQGERSLRALHAACEDRCWKVPPPQCGLPETFNTLKELEELLRNNIH